MLATVGCTGKRADRQRGAYTAAMIRFARRLRMSLCVLLLAATGLVSRPASAAPRHYALDPVHTRVQFAVDHAGLSRALGSFSGITGALQLDPDDLGNAKVEAHIPITSLELGDAGWRNTMLARTWLAAERYPDAHFVSTRVEPGPDGALTVHGTLSLRGFTRDISLAARLNAIKRHPLNLRRTAGFSATTTIRRSDFGMGAWPSLVGDAVELRIEVEAVRRRPPRTPSPETDHADPQ